MCNVLSKLTKNSMGPPLDFSRSQIFFVESRDQF